jgi:hypothetical protein
VEVPPQAEALQPIPIIFFGVSDIFAQFLIPNFLLPNPNPLHPAHRLAVSTFHPEQGTAAAFPVPASTARRCSSPCRPPSRSNASAPPHHSQRRAHLSSPLSMAFKDRRRWRGLEQPGKGRRRTESWPRGARAKAKPVPAHQKPHNNDPPIPNYKP